MTKKVSTPGLKTSLVSDLYRFWLFLLPGRVGQVCVLLIVMLLAAVFEMATLAAVVPLIGSLVDSQSDGGMFLTDSINLPQFIVTADDPHTLVLGGTILIVSISALIRILVIRMSAEFSASLGIDLQTQYFRNLLNREYESAVNESSSKKISLITNKIQIVISSYILGILNSLTAVISAVGVIIMLVWLSTSVVFVALGLLVGAYVVIAWVTRTKLRNYGRDIQIYIPRKVKCVQEGLGGFRDVAMGGTQEVFVQRLHDIASKVERANARLTFYYAFPRPLLEAIGIACVALIAWLAHQGSFANENLLPTLGVFALGMLRLLPFVQQVFGQWSKLVNGQLILADFVRDLVDDEESEASSVAGEAVRTSGTQYVPFNHSIVMKNVGFTYQGVEQRALHGLNLHIGKGEYIGIVGPTGSGKSTLVDILMGLLPPTSGKLEIDELALTDINRKHWCHQVAHVPQKIYLSEGSIESNIAFAVNDENIDRQLVAQSAKQACVDEFINTLPEGYKTAVGEDGVRLSGGQRQRLGIARALYSGCKVLILDEATNALDDVTEKEIVDGLLHVDGDYTIISITHNLNSVRNCHRILQIDDGTARWL